MVDLERTRNVEVLRQAAKVLDDENLRLRQQLLLATEALAQAKGIDPAERQAMLEGMEKQLEAARRAAFGGGSERRPRDKEPKKKAPQKGHGPTPQPELPIEEVFHSFDDADRTCPDCGDELKDWKDQFEESEEIDVVELRYVRKQHKRQKVRCKCGHIEVAEGPKRLIPGGRYSSAFALQVVDDRFNHAIPLHRQERQMRQAGLQVTRQTLWDQVWAVTTKLSAAVTRLHAHLLSQEVVLADETRWPLLGTKGRKSTNYYIWALAARDGVVYSIQDTRSNEAGRALLQGFSGVAVTDGYIVYSSLASQGEFTLAHDWCHVRRKFLEAEATAPEIAEPIIQKLGELFLVEREIKKRTAQLSATESRKLCEQIRQKESKDIINAIGRLATEVRAPKESPIAKAVSYLQNRWDGLCVCVHDGRVPIDTNAVERSLRTAVLGRKNSLGSKSKRGLQAAQTMHSLIESAKLCGLNPRDYLRQALDAALDERQIPLPHELR